jgi:hypothetical protein
MTLEYGDRMREIDRATGLPYNLYIVRKPIKLL